MTDEEILMTSQIQLSKEAHAAARFRKHKMTRFKKTNNKNIRESECNICGYHMWINSNPMPNEIRISGKAVALNCRQKQRGIK